MIPQIQICISDAYAEKAESVALTPHFFRHTLYLAARDEDATLDMTGSKHTCKKLGACTEVH